MVLFLLNSNVLLMRYEQKKRRAQFLHNFVTVKLPEKDSKVCASSTLLCSLQESWSPPESTRICWKIQLPHVLNCSIYKSRHNDKFDTDLLIHVLHVIHS